MDPLFTALEDELDHAVALRQRLHATPELGHREHGTAAIVEGALPVAAKRVAGTGLLAQVGPQTGPPVVVRAELDGLPITERTGAAAAATNGAMHACGHDIHMAALVALARAAHASDARLPAPLLALFQPSEEAYPSGAVDVLADPALPSRTAALVGAHVHPLVPWNSVALDPGAINASSDTVTIRVEGVGAHAAYPHTGRDPIQGLASVVVALYGAVPRRIDPLEAATFSIGVINAGGAENVIPDCAEAKGTLRALRTHEREELSSAIEEIAVATASALGCRAVVQIERGAPALVNDPELVETARGLLRRTGTDLAPSWRSLGADDFSYYASRGRLAMAFVGLAGAPGFEPRALHHREFLPPDEAVAHTARTLAALYLAAAA